MDSAGQFEITARIPAGFASAAMEIRIGENAWRTMVSGAIDGRAASVIISWPRLAGTPAAMARVRCSTAGAPPVAELSDPALYTVIYDDPGGTISEQTKLDNLRALMVKRSEWKALSATERNNNLITYARTLPNVSDAGFSSLAATVYINYPDGDTSVIIDNRGPGKLLTPRPQAELDGGIHALADKNFPQSINAICAYSLETATYPDSTPEVTNWLTRAGYSVSRTTSLTVEDILAWKNRQLAVFFWQTHSGSLKAGETHPEQMCISIGQLATVALSQGRYKTMRSGPAWELLLGVTPNPADPDNEEAYLPVYALTTAFIKKYLTGMFAQNSVCAMDSCTGAHPDLADLFLGHGAGVHISWDWLSGPESGTRFRQLFDRLTGSNAEAPFSVPAERPFIHERTQKWMQDFAFDLDPSDVDPARPGIAQLIWKYNLFDPAYGLVPSIYRVLFEYRDAPHDFTKMLIEGEFGRDPGPSSRLVTWGDQVCQVLSWDENEGILIKPPGPPYPTGNIQVTVGNHKSNEVPITEWAIPVTYNLKGKGSLEHIINFTLRLRGDIRRGREEPGEDGGLYPVILEQLGDSTGTLTSTGSYRESEDSTITWSGGSALHSGVGSQNDPQVNAIRASANLNLRSGELENFMVFCTGNYIHTVTTSKGSVSITQTAVLDPFVMPLPGTVNLSTSLLDGESIPPIFPPFNGLGVSATMSWPATQGKPAATPDTPR